MMLFFLICVAGCLHFANLSAIPAAESRSSLSKEYKLFYYTSGNWYNAGLACNDNGMRLATINSQEEQDYLTKLITDADLPNLNWWISLSDLAVEGRYSWFSSGAMMTYKNWVSGAPNNGGTSANEHCVVFQNNKQWNDIQCATVYPFVCETIPTK